MSASTWTLNTAQRKVVTTEHYEWDDEKGDWKAVSKSVVTEDGVGGPVAPYGYPYPQRQPYRPYYGEHIHTIPVQDPGYLPKITW